jgi:hypothetical protein
MKAMRIFTLIFVSILLLITMISKAKADTVSSLHLTGLGNYVGKHLTVYYALGARASINTEDDQLKLRSIKLKKTFTITGDTMTLPAVELQRTGVILPYNIIVLVVHKTADFRWVNADGSVADGETSTGPSQFIMVDSLTKMEFEALQKSNVQSYQFGELRQMVSRAL